MSVIHFCWLPTVSFTLLFSFFLNFQLVGRNKRTARRWIERRDVAIRELCMKDIRWWICWTRWVTGKSVEWVMASVEGWVRCLFPMAKDAFCGWMFTQWAFLLAPYERSMIKRDGMQRKRCVFTIKRCQRDYLPAFTFDNEIKKN